MPSREIDVRTLAEHLGGEARGPETTVVSLAAPDRAQPGSVVVAVDGTALERALARSPAVVVVPVELDVPRDAPCAVVTVANARLAFARLSVLFDDRPVPSPGVHPTAVVASGASLGPDVSVGPLAVVEDGAQIGAGSIIGPQCAIGEGARLGRACRLHAAVTLYDGVHLGDRVRLHSGCVIGADGFGYASGPAGAEKIHHLAGVVVEDDVEIGAGTAVDRGTVDPTRVGARSKIDNLCQIGHNTRIGRDCLIAAMAGIGGSVTLEDGVVLGGYVAVADHVSIHAGARVAGRSGVTKDIPAGETWAGFPAQPYRRWVRGLYLHGKLERMWRAVRERDDER
ncbi:MAG: UDP-3-O-(3-hydroxymyristoyl)glucosamine N-acyltransferase [Deinococcales bacterium]